MTTPPTLGPSSSEDSISDLHLEAAPHRRDHRHAAAPEQVRDAGGIEEVDLGAEDVPPDPEDAALDALIEAILGE